jgi:hypothetical protein
MHGNPSIFTSLYPIERPHLNFVGGLMVVDFSTVEKILSKGMVVAVEETFIKQVHLTLLCMNVPIVSRLYRCASSLFALAFHQISYLWDHSCILISSLVIQNAGELYLYNQFQLGLLNNPTISYTSRLFLSLSCSWMRACSMCHI